MKSRTLLGWAVCLAVFAVGAQGEIVTVSWHMDHNDNGVGMEPLFIPPGVILDHSPYYATALEDWGWRFDLADRVPADANGIASATLWVRAWDSDVSEGQIDLIYANGVELGPLNDTFGRNWRTTSFELPAQVLDDLWNDAQLHCFIDVDTDNTGQRVTLGYSALFIDYVLPDGDPEPSVTVHRFWSPTLSGHFYTADERERAKLVYDYPGVWTYEIAAYHAFPDDRHPNAAPVHRFWSDQNGAHFYTIDETEKDFILDTYPHVWEYEGIAFYAHAEGQQPDSSSPVYRFWSNTLSRHFYTTDEAERDFVIDTYPVAWTYEGVAWHAYP
jgi:hypothetical protein